MGGSRARVRRCVFTRIPNAFPCPRKLAETQSIGGAVRCWSGRGFVGLPFSDVCPGGLWAPPPRPPPLRCASPGVPPNIADRRSRQRRTRIFTFREVRLISLMGLMTGLEGNVCLGISDHFWPLRNSAASAPQLHPLPKEGRRRSVIVIASSRAPQSPPPPPPSNPPLTCTHAPDPVEKQPGIRA